MQIIDELEVNKRGPYGGGMGYVAYNDNMDIALALRTMVIPNPPPSAADSDSIPHDNKQARKEWTVHLQVGTAAFVLLLAVACCYSACQVVCCSAALEALLDSEICATAICRDLSASS